ncbi:hypothetical protein D5086_028972 [Populus alba]|uniref:Uncharacterized protein n=1 Tax=Populus alba TaxID=43335 RepID=A0ACC4AS53_POPAL
MIDGYCKLGDMDGAESLLREMERKQVVPNVITYSSIINGYTKKGMLDVAVRIMKKMLDQNIMPNAYIYATLIDGHFKAGKQDAAVDLYFKAFQTDCRIIESATPKQARSNGA